MHALSGPFFLFTLILHSHALPFTAKQDGPHRRVGDGTLPICATHPPPLIPAASDCELVYEVMTDTALRMGDPEIFGTRGADHSRWTQRLPYLWHYSGPHGTCKIKIDTQPGFRADYFHWSEVARAIEDISLECLIGPRPPSNGWEHVGAHGGINVTIMGAAESPNQGLPVGNMSTMGGKFWEYLQRNESDVYISRPDVATA